MNGLKTISDIHVFINRLSDNFTNIPENLELKITLCLNDYVKIQKEFFDLSLTFPNEAGNTWITYQYMGVKTNIELVNA